MGREVRSSAKALGYNFLFFFSFLFPWLPLTAWITLDCQVLNPTEVKGDCPAPLDNASKNTFCDEPGQLSNLKPTKFKKTEAIGNCSSPLDITLRSRILRKRV